MVNGDIMILPLTFCSYERFDNMTTIYARRSVYNADSISIETQIETCKNIVRGEAIQIYKDNGFSGKDTDRPDFQRLMKDIKSGIINKIVVYKLDRISRSVLDIAELIRELEKLHVDFVSATENYETTTPMGKAMLNMSATFAQLERENIAARVKGAYISRSHRGFYMGGRVPYGFELTPTVIGGINTKKFVIEPIKAHTIQRMYEIYSQPNTSLGDVRRQLISEGIIREDGSNWTTAKLSDLMRNPVYVKADSKVYEFFQNERANIINSLDDFNGKNGCYLYTGENTNRKTWDLANQTLVIAPHEGFIDSETWLYCRKKLLGNHQIKWTKAKNSWLSGKVKCGHCGHAMVIKRSNNNNTRYFICTGRSSYNCKKPMPTIYADAFENLIKMYIAKKLDELTLRPNAKKDECDLQIQKLEAESTGIDADIRKLVDMLMQADETSMKYIQEKIRELDGNKQCKLDEIQRLKSNRANNLNLGELHNVMNLWDKLSFDDKRGVAELLIEKISVYPKSVEIIWKV